MRLALAVPLPAKTARPPLRQRATSLVLAVAITLLMILGFWTLNGSAPERPRFKGSPTLLDFKPDAEKADTTRKQAPKPQPREEAEVPPKTPPPTPVPPPPLPEPLPTRSYYIHLTREENEAADISKIPRAAPAGAAGAGAQQASAAGDSRPVGTAPDGSPLYPAEWYRRPTNAELGFYLPAHRPTNGWGLIACKTVANHHVEDCVELGSSPPGSHLAGAVRQAAWQFLVRAPRLGGKELVGAWVSIRIDYVTTTTKEEDSPPPESGD